MAKLAVASLKELLHVVQESKSNYASIFIKYYGDHDDQGRSWCPDCVKGNFIRKAKGHFSQLI